MVEINAQVKKLVDRIVKFLASFQLDIGLHLDGEEVVVAEFSNQEAFILVYAVDDIFVYEVKNFQNEELFRCPRSWNIFRNPPIFFSVKVTLNQLE